ncbi:MAG TPA: ribose-5-phosphate isomerase RpiA [Candidatus Krumholzibacteria bacterium]|jgi:ribose 5-phosphate isomerase A|nr:ribose-5-phosphate isomerase RpiA [Candidatus Krumholzibacteria bacterium]
MEPKERAARSAVAVVRNGEILGLGSGSTAMRALQVLAERIRAEKLDVIGVPTSLATQKEAERLGIPLTTLELHPELDLAIDGADQVDARLAVIKGYGGALLREKIVARCARRVHLMVDTSKLADTLRLAVPVEVLPFAMGAAWRRLEALGGKPRLRLAGKAPYLSDNGNKILDVDFGAIEDPAALAARLDVLPGVMGHGLFVDLVDELHVGDTAASRVIRRTEVR